MVSFARCCNRFATLARSAAKAGAARLRDIGFGSVHPRWAQRASICETCPMRVLHNRTLYCGTPLLRKAERDEAIDGCGCPCHAKARSPDEHCPVDVRYRPAAQTSAGCTCKWCASH